jgi:hypothetical protein
MGETLGVNNQRPDEVRHGCFRVAREAPNHFIGLRDESGNPKHFTWNPVILESEAFHDVCDPISGR